MVTALKHYVGTKAIQAMPMTLGTYNEFRGWSIPSNEDPNKPGYLVVYSDSYQSWSPKEVFDASYYEVSGLTFGIAMEAAKMGAKIARSGWNGKSMFVVYQKGYPEGIQCNEQTAKAWDINEGDTFRCEPYLQIKMVNDSHAMWVPSINDVLATDWVIV